MTHLTTDQEPTMPPPMTRDEWLAERRKVIGGTDLAAIMGLNPYKSPWDVWADKTGQVEPEPENQAMKMGRMLEPVVRALYEERHGATIAPGFLKDPRYHVGGTPDALTDATVIDFKTTKGFVFRSWQGIIPTHYWAQLQCYMFLTGARNGVLAVLVDGRDYHELHCVYDAEWTDGAVRDAKAWWERHIIDGQEPERTTNPQPEAETGAAIEADDTVKRALQDLTEVRELEKAIKDRRAECEEAIKEFMGSNEVLTIAGNAAATWKAVTSTRIDTKALRAAQPTIADQYTKTTTTRTFRLTT